MLSGFPFVLVDVCFVHHNFRAEVNNQRRDCATKQEADNINVEAGSAQIAAETSKVEELRHVISTRVTLS